MRAVNLVPADARRSRGRSGGVSLGTFGAAQFLVALLVIVVALVVLRVLADNTVNNRKATLSAVEQQVTTEQAEANALSKYVAFVENIQNQESQVREIAEQRFPWKRTLDQISHVLPASTSLTSLNATTSGAETASGAAATGPLFTVAGCANTPNQNGVATLLRRLTQVTGVTNVGFESSTRQAACGNSFNVQLSFAAPGVSGTGSSSVSTSGVESTTTTATTTTTTTTTGTSTG